ncbi:MAG: translation initiation factor IF-2 associated domain-containing protein, partial [Thermoanaerobaculia bacterium]
MAQMSVAQFASELKMDPARLLEQLQSAGVIKKVADDTLTEQDKTRLLDYLHQVHGGGEARKKITVTRKQTTEIKKADSFGKARTIQVEVRRKRVFVKRDPSTPVPEPEPEAVPVPASAPEPVAAEVPIVSAG